MKPITNINLECIPEKEYISPEFKISPISESNGLFIYETSDPSVFTVDQDGVVTITGPGKAYLLVQQLESENFSANQIERLIVVNKSKPSISFVGPSSLALDQTNTSLKILKIETVSGLINDVFSTNENVLKINQVSEGQYELIPQSFGQVSITASTKNNYYFEQTFANFNIVVEKTFNDSPIVLNINTFQPAFKHDGIKEIDILTSNSNITPTNNNIEIAVQQLSPGYEYDIPILNLNAQNFINSIENFDREIIFCTENYLDFSIEWNYNSNTVYEFFPYESLQDTTPRINIFRSDGKYVNYISGGFIFLKIPKDSSPGDPNAFTYIKYGNRNAGIQNFRLPSGDAAQSPSLYYGVEFTTRDDLLPDILVPSLGSWIVTTPTVGETKYQYLFTGNYTKDIYIRFPRP
jgi:hypothetical protein